MSEENREQTLSESAAGTAPGGHPGEVAVFPYLVYKEFLSALLISIVLLVWSMVMNAPLLPEADPGKTENPAKAPWYFVGLQELLVYFDPWIAGVGLPTLIIVGLMAIPYLDTTRHHTGEYTFRHRRFVIGNFLFGFTLWWVLIAVGQVLRGPNWQFYWPWESWAVAKTTEESLRNFPLWLGLPLLILYFAAGFVFPRIRWPKLYRQLGGARFTVAMTFLMIMYAVPIKIVLRLFFRVKYVLVTPWFNI